MLLLPGGLVSRCTRRSLDSGYKAHQHAVSLLAARLHSTPSTRASTMALEVLPLPLPSSIDKEKFNKNLGSEVRGVDLGKLSEGEFKEIEQLLYRVGGRYHSP